MQLRLGGSGHDRTKAAWAKALRGRPVPASSADHPARLNRGGRYSFLLVDPATGFAASRDWRIVTVDMIKPVLSLECCSGGHTCTCPG